MTRIVLTGGPCSGKTTTLAALREEFGDRLVLVPEAATMLLGSGFPVPGKDCPWSDTWQAAFQQAIATLQRSLEAAYALVAQQRAVSLLVCDRGLLDGAAYTPGGTEDFCARYGVDRADAFARYDTIVHLESLATAAPEKYGRSGNDRRFEPLEEAKNLEARTRAIWSEHPRQIVIGAGRGIDGKIAEVVGIVRYLLAGSGR